MARMTRAQRYAKQLINMPVDALERNYKVLMNNPLNCPEWMAPSHQETADWMGPVYRTEFTRRGLSIPKVLKRRDE